MNQHEQDDLNDERKEHKERYATLARLLAEITGERDTAVRLNNKQVNNTLAAQDELAKVKRELTEAREELLIAKNEVEASNAYADNLKAVNAELKAKLTDAITGG
jgi:uncharacterized membrane-anchored protein YhcB (DUF1043 family)